MEYVDVIKQISHKGHLTFEDFAQAGEFPTFQQAIADELDITIPELREKLEAESIPMTGIQCRCILFDVASGR